MRKILLLALAILAICLTGLSYGTSEEKSTRICKPHYICVIPGDFLKYSVKNGTGFETYVFGDFIGEDKINLLQTIGFEDNVEQTKYILDMKTNLANNTEDGSIMGMPMFLPLPFNSTPHGTSFSEVTEVFKGIERSIYVVTNSSSSITDELRIDKKTGVIISHSVRGNRANILVSELNDTNIFQSATSQPDQNYTSQVNTSSNVESEKIPRWVQNNVKWWNEGSIADLDFTKGIKYLIQQGIIHVNQTSSESQSVHHIPVWIKNLAKLWADEKISDDDFLKGIEYLVNVGIIKV
jgi:hypothetical protein